MNYAFCNTTTQLEYTREYSKLTHHYSSPLAHDYTANINAHTNSEFPAMASHVFNANEMRVFRVGAFRLWNIVHEEMKPLSQWIHLSLFLGRSFSQEPSAMLFAFSLHF